jgi:hypothetical protein
MFRPEFRISLDGLKTAESLKLMTFAPKFTCEQIEAATRENNCGVGAEIGMLANSENGLSNISAKVMADRLGNRTQSSLQISLEQRF